MVFLPSLALLLLQISSEFFMREVLGMEREWGALAWDTAGRGICYMLLEAVGYLSLVSCVAGDALSALSAAYSLSLSLSSL